jgi:hypothetical protein
LGPFQREAKIQYKLKWNEKDILTLMDSISGLMKTTTDTRILINLKNKVRDTPANESGAKLGVVRLLPPDDQARECHEHA